MYPAVMEEPPVRSSALVPLLDSTSTPPGILTVDPPLIKNASGAAESSTTIWAPGEGPGPPTAQAATVAVCRLLRIRMRCRFWGCWMITSTYLSVRKPADALVVGGLFTV